MAVAYVMAVAFLVNLPLGVWRSRVRKFSPVWFLAVHLSIPLIIWLRYRWGVPALYIPLSLGSAVLGQVVGGRAGRRPAAPAAPAPQASED